MRIFYNVIQAALLLTWMGGCVAGSFMNDARFMSAGWMGFFLLLLAPGSKK